MRIAMIGQKGIGDGFPVRGNVSGTGGIETHVLAIATRLVRRGHDVTAYGRTWYVPRGTSRVNAVDIVRLPSIRTKNLDTITYTLLSTMHAVLWLRPDVYHFHGVGPSLLAWIPRLFAPRATVMTTFHSLDRMHEKWGWFARRMLRLGERASLRFADETFASSRSLVSYIEREYGKRATYVPNGITPVRTAVDPLLLSPFSLEPFRYIAVMSRLVPHKEIHTLITAWKLARPRLPAALHDVKLAIVGGGSFTDDYVRKLEGMAMGDDSIVMTGFQRGDTLNALFAGALFMVHPSRSEGLPIAVLEEMSYGKAVIAADIPETMEVVSEYGVAFPVGDSAALADLIVDFILDPMQAAALGHAARTFVETEYHWDDITDAILATYRKHALVRTGVFAVR